MKEFLKVLQFNPEDWQARTKLIQNYQALNMTEERERERLELHRLFRMGKVPTPRYCRDLFEEGEFQVIVNEYFTLGGQGATPVRYIFTATKGPQVLFRITLGSYDMTNLIYQDLIPKEGGIEERRVYHLDGYFSNRFALSSLTRVSTQCMLSLVANLLMTSSKKMSFKLFASLNHK